MIRHDFQQYTDEWWEVRRGVPTASNADKILTPTGKASSSQDKYACQLIADTLDPNYGRVESYQSAAMKNGLILEPEARAFYEFDRGVTLTQVGFCLTDDGRFGCSPDALWQNGERGLEIKSPIPATHIEYLLAGGMPNKYKPQVHMSMLVTGLEVWDFMSYCPGFPPLLVEVERDEFTEQLAEQMEKFKAKYDKWLNKVNEIKAQMEGVTV